MKMKFNHFIYQVFGMIILFQLPLFAQRENEKNKVKLRVDLVSLGETIPGLYLGKQKGKRVDVLAFRYDKTLRYSGDRVIQISQGNSKTEELASSSGEDETNSIKPLSRKDRTKKEEPSPNDKLQMQIEKLRKKNPNLVALATVPPGSRHITILLIPAPNNTYKTLVFDDDSKKMPYGKLRIHNFCKSAIQMNFADTKPATIKANKSHQVNVKKQSVRYLLKYRKKGKWKAQESNIVRVTSDQQVRMIVLKSKSSFFQSGSGSRGGHLQIVFLRRDRTVRPPRPEDSIPNEDLPPLPDGRKQK